LLGAALATLISYVTYVFIAQRMGARKFPISFPLLDTLKFATMALVMYGLVLQVHLHNTVIDLLAKVSVGIVAYGGLILAFDRPSREILLELRAKVAGWI
jgi:hypothetical protein